MGKPRKRITRLTLARPIEQIEQKVEVTCDGWIPDPTAGQGCKDVFDEPHKLRIQINVGRLLASLGVKALNSSSGRSQEANGAIVVTVVR